MAKLTNEIFEEVARSKLVAPSIHWRKSRHPVTKVILKYEDHKVKGIGAVVVVFRSQYNPRGSNPAATDVWALSAIQVKEREDGGEVVGTYNEAAAAVNMTPGARDLIKKYDLEDEVREIKATGKGGKLLKSDVENYVDVILEEKEEEVKPAPKKGGKKTAEPVVEPEVTEEPVE